ncbi:hypothetical protein GCM10022206_17290 [Streptomyces chiangmaiensis]
MARASQIMAPTSCFTGQVHYLPDAPKAYGATITRAKAAPPQTRSTDLCVSTPRNLIGGLMREPESNGETHSVFNYQCPLRPTQASLDPSSATALAHRVPGV